MYVQRETVHNNVVERFTKHEAYQHDNDIVKLLDISVCEGVYGPEHLAADA